MKSSPSKNVRNILHILYHQPSIINNTSPHEITSISAEKIKDKRSDHRPFDSPSAHYHPQLSHSLIRPKLFLLYTVISVSPLSHHLIPLIDMTPLHYNLTHHYVYKGNVSSVSHLKACDHCVTQCNKLLRFYDTIFFATSVGSLPFKNPSESSSLVHCCNKVTSLMY